MQNIKETAKPSYIYLKMKLEEEAGRNYVVRNVQI